MHRVELKGVDGKVLWGCVFEFLMHRVELKDPTIHQPDATSGPVPNAPCGVESLGFLGFFAMFRHLLFLMHRVELKEGSS